jgi:hypothetical protein
MLVLAMSRTGMVTAHRKSCGAPSQNDQSGVALTIQAPLRTTESLRSAIAAHAAFQILPSQPTEVLEPLTRTRADEPRMRGRHPPHRCVSTLQ